MNQSDDQIKQQPPEQLRAIFEPDPDNTKCPHCGEVWTNEMLLDSKRVPEHDFPRPCRAICPGSGRFPLAANDPRPLEKDVEINK